jgi:cell division inhibitor SulA
MGLVDPAVSLPALLARPDIRRGGELARVASASVTTGFPQLDAELPGGGWPTSSLTELLPSHEGIGELRILGPALAALARAGQRLAWIAPPYLPYAPALAAAGIDLARILIVKTRTARDALWATEQALQSATCGAVLLWPSEVKYVALRRLQLAAERSQAMTVLFRPQSVAGEASPAALRLALHTAAGGLAVRILKRRGAVCERPVIIDLARPSPLEGMHKGASTWSSSDEQLHPAVDRPPPPEPAARSADARACHA